MAILLSYFTLHRELLIQLLKLREDLLKQLLPVLRISNYLLLHYVYHLLLVHTLKRPHMYLARGLAFNSLVTRSRLQL